MSGSTTPAGGPAPGAGTSSAPGREPAFWERYSPHHEFPVSGTTSLVVHGTVIAVLFLGGYLALKLGAADRDKPLSYDAVNVEAAPGPPGPLDKDPKLDGGGGEEKKEHLEEPKEGELILPKKVDPLPAPDARPPSLLAPNAFATPNEVPRDIEAPGQAARDVLREQIARDAKKDTGEGTGPAGPGHDEGGRTGGGGRKPTIQDVRRHRWQLTLATRNGEDYVRQLHALQAIVVVPLRDKQYYVIRNLISPYPGKAETLETLPDFFWVDRDPSSVHGLARTLSLPADPPYVVVFLPKDVEDKLLEAELKAFHGPEEKIKETHFDLIWRGGEYVLRVTSQTHR